MKKVIIYCTIQSDHMFAQPEETNREIVDVDNEKALQKYIESKTDGYGHLFKKKEKMFGDFAYTSRAGGVKVEDYKKSKKPIIKKI